MWGLGTTTLTPGDTLTLEFAATPVPEGQVREWFLVTRGVYTSAPAANAPPGQGQPPRSGFALAQNQPNPFAATTIIAFELPIATAVRLEVFDLLGRRVSTLAEGKYPAGSHRAEWDRRDAAGVMVSPGVDLYRITAATFAAQKKVVLLPH